jgi:hypothetical protein
MANRSTTNTLAFFFNAHLISLTNSEGVYTDSSRSFLQIKAKRPSIIHGAQPMQGKQIGHLLTPDSIPELPPLLPE